MIGAALIAAVACGKKDKDKDDPACSAPAADGTCPSTVVTQPAAGSSQAGAGTTVKNPVAEVSLVLPELTRRMYADDDAAARTLSIVAVGDTVECSTDGGTTYGACADSKTWVWNAADFNKVHTVRASATVDSKTASAVASFTPSETYPSLQFVTCTKSITASTGVDAFLTAAGLSTPNQVVCLGNGVTIEPVGSDSTRTIQLGADGIRILTGAGQTAMLRSASGITFDTAGYDDFYIAGVHLSETSGRRAALVRTDGSNRSLGVTFDDVDVECTGNLAGQCLDVANAGSSSRPVYIRNSRLFRENPGSAAALHVDDGHVTLEDSNVKGGYHALDAHGGSSVLALNAAFTSLSTTPSMTRGVVHAYNDTAVRFEGGSIHSNADYAIVLESSNETIGTKVVLNGVTLVRDGGVTDTSAIYLGSGSISPVVDSTTNGNLLCTAHEAANGHFTGFFAGATNSGTLLPASQVNGGVVGPCP